MAYAGKKAQLKVTGDPLGFTDESFSTTDDLIYTIDDESKEIWGAFSTITVYDNGIEITDDFTLNRLTGQIIFETADSREITADGEYLPLSIIGEAFAYGYTLSAENVETTRFGSEYTQREQALLDFESTLEKFHEIDSYFYEALVESHFLVVEYFYHEDEPYDLRARVLISEDEITGSVEEMIEDGITVEGTSDKENRVAT